MWGGKHLSGIPDRDFCRFYPHKRTSTWRFFSHTRSGFPLFLPIWEISISHTRTSPREKNEHHHVGRTSFRDVIVMLKCQQIQDFLEVFFMVSNIKCGTYNAPLAITLCHHSASLVMPISDPRDKFFLSHPHTHNSYNLPNPALRNDKKLTAACSPYVDPWRHCEVKMTVTSPWHITAYSGFSGSLFHLFLI